jgi:hypothetical protein
MRSLVRPVNERSTRQRRAIREAFERAGRPLSTDEVLAEAQATKRALGHHTRIMAIQRELADALTGEILGTRDAALRKALIS